MSDAVVGTVAIVAIGSALMAIGFSIATVVTTSSSDWTAACHDAGGRVVPLETRGGVDSYRCVGVE